VKEEMLVGFIRLRRHMGFLRNLVRIIWLKIQRRVHALIFSSVKIARDPHPHQMKPYKKTAGR